MNSIILKNGKRYALVQPARIETRFEQGAKREVMVLNMPAADLGLDTVAANFQNAESTSVLKLAQGGKEYSYTDYSVFLGAAIKPVVFAEESPAMPQKRELCVSVELGRLTYIEKQLQQLGVQI